MRANEFLDELRRNPEQNVRVSGWDQFVNIYNQYAQTGDTSNLYISLTELEKLGVNPMSEHETPNGIYAYPADYVIKTKSFEKLPYANEQPWVNVFTAKPDANIVRIDTMTKEQAQGYLQKLINSYPERADEIKELIKAAPKNAFADDGWDDVPGRKKLKKVPGAQLWYVTFELSEWNMNLWNKLFRSMGIDGALDLGSGIIHHMEPTQAVFFNPAAVNLINRFPNNTQPSEKSINKRRAAGQEQTKTKRSLNSSSEQEQIEWMKRLHNYENFKYIKNPSPKVQKAAVMLRPNNILYIKNPSPELLQYAIKKEPHLIGHFPNTPELQIAAIGKDWTNIDYIDNPLPETVQYVMRIISRGDLKMIQQEVIDAAKMGMRNPFPWLPVQ